MVKGFAPQLLLTAGAVLLVGACSSHALPDGTAIAASPVATSPWVGRWIGDATAQYDDVLLINADGTGEYTIWAPVFIGGPTVHRFRWEVQPDGRLRGTGLRDGQWLELRLQPDGEHIVGVLRWGNPDRRMGPQRSIQFRKR